MSSDPAPSAQTKPPSNQTESDKNNLNEKKLNKDAKESDICDDWEQLDQKVTLNFNKF